MGNPSPMRSPPLCGVWARQQHRQQQDGRWGRGNYCITARSSYGGPYCRSCCGGRYARRVQQLRIAFVNLKPGTAKTTSAVWLADAFHRRDLEVLLADSDPAASALRWSDLAAPPDKDDDQAAAAARRRREPEGGFPWRLAGLPVRDFHRRIRDVTRGVDVAIADVPQIEDHAGIARSVMRWATDIVIPVAPSGVELDRMAPIRREIEDLEAVRSEDARDMVLLTRTVTGAASTKSARTVLTAQGHDVLTTTIPRLELFAGSFGGLVDARGTAYDALATELLDRRGLTSEGRVQ